MSLMFPSLTFQAAARRSKKPEPTFAMPFEASWKCQRTKVRLERFWQRRATSRKNGGKWQGPEFVSLDRLTMSL